MNRSTKVDSIDGQQSAVIPDPPAKRLIRKRSKKRARNRKKFAEAGSGIRETEEARALLENQLSSLYWWVFHAFKMKGFIRAKALDELQRARINRNERDIEYADFAGDHVLPEK